jgi:hypothetical protein
LFLINITDFKKTPNNCNLSTTIFLPYNICVPGKPLNETLLSHYKEWSISKYSLGEKITPDI